MNRVAYTVPFETCLCAAVRVDMKIYRGHRHNHALAAANDALSWNHSRKEISEMNMEQGFLTTRGRFVSRDEGLLLQKRAGIPSATGGYGPKLYSEDLY